MQKINREAFEAWVIEFRLNVILRRFENGEYVSAVTENYFNVWQAALASQAQQEPVSQWISVEERLPEENTYVLCSYKRFGEWLVHEGSYDEKGRFTLSVIDAKVRYWMPLPLPPAPEGGDK